jgi:hypothetical protein
LFAGTDFYISYLRYLFDRDIFENTSSVYFSLFKDEFLNILYNDNFIYLILSFFPSIIFTPRSYSASQIFEKINTTIKMNDEQKIFFFIAVCYCGSESDVQKNGFFFILSITITIIVSI